jgi:hypothetical protein
MDKHLYNSILEFCTFEADLLADKMADHILLGEEVGGYDLLAIVLDSDNADDMDEINKLMIFHVLDIKREKQSKYFEKTLTEWCENKAQDFLIRHKVISEFENLH